MAYCAYYQACVYRSQCWYFVAVLRSFEYTAFDRTYDVATSTFEFFVPPSMEPEFLTIMRYFEQEKLITDLKKLPIENVI